MQPTITDPNPRDAAPENGSGILRVLPPCDDAEALLIAAAQRGDRQAMHQLLAPWNDRIFGFVLTLLRHHADAEDAAQETFLRVVKGLPGYEHRGDFRAWIFRIARNQASLTATQRQRVAARETAVEPEQLQDFPAADETDDAATAERAQALRSAVDELPAAEREVVLLRLNDDLKFREIAERTHSPLNTVLGRMRNAMRRLHETLQPLTP